MHLTIAPSFSFEQVKQNIMINLPSSKIVGIHDITNTIKISMDITISAPKIEKGYNLNSIIFFDKNFHPVRDIVLNI